MKSRDTIILVIFFFVLSIFSITYFSYYIDHADKALSNDVKCQTIPRSDSYQLTKQITHRWNWLYRNEDSIDVEQNCVSINHDANILLNGKYVGGTDAKTLSFTSKSFIRDCHGDTIVIMKTGNLFKTTINQNNIFVSFEFKDKKDNVITYSDATHFITDNIVIKDVENNVIARMRRNKASIKWIWNINVENQNHTMSDPRILLSIAGKRAFSEKSDDLDDCNIVFWLFFTIAIVLAAGWIYFIYYIVREYRSNKPMISDIKASVQTTEDYLL